MMREGILQELLTIVLSAIDGARIPLVYDFLCIFRRILRHGNFWIALEDLVFWMWTAFWVFSVLYRVNDGELRIYTIASMAVGMVLYKITIIRLGKKLKYLWKRVIMKFRQER